MVMVAVVAVACGDGDVAPDSESSSAEAAASPTTTVAPPTTTVAPPTTASPTTTVAPTTTAPPTEGPEPVLPMSADCTGLGEPPSGGELTFVAMDRLWQIEPDASITCLAEVPDSAEMVAWSPRGDRVVFGDGRVLEAGGESRAPGGISGEVAGWTWPTGVRFLETDGPALRKHEADGSGVIDISVVDHHEVVDYHPDGLHFAVFGTAPVTFLDFDEDGNETPSVFDQLGLFIVRNGDPEPHQLIHPEDAVITDAGFSADGTRLSFVAVHDGVEHHVHSFDLSLMIFEDGEQKILTALREERDLTEAYAESADELHNLAIDPATPQRILYGEGSCGEGSTVHLLEFVGYDAEVVSIADGLDAIPIGFLSGNRAAVLEVGDDCASSGALWVIDLDDGTRTKVATDVTSATVRAPAPALRLSLRDVVIAGFA